MRWPTRFHWEIAARQALDPGLGLSAFLSKLSIVGMLIAVSLLLAALSVMNGFERELRERILNLVPHVVLINSRIDSDWRSGFTDLEDLEVVQEITPYAELQGLIYARGKTQPLRLLGFSKDQVPAGFASILQEQSLELPKSGEVLLSKTLLNRLKVSLGQSVRLVFPGTQSGVPRVQRLTVSGVFATHTELDQVLAIGQLEQVAQIAGFESGIGGFRVQLDDPFKAREVGYQLLEKFLIN